MNLERFAERVDPLDSIAMDKARRRMDNIAKPLYSLGVFEDDLIKLAGIYKTEKLDISKKCVVVMCADNGVVAQGVSPSDVKVTAVMTAGFANSNCTVCKLAEGVKADVIPVDIGVAADVSAPGLLNRKVAYGTKDISVEAAMTREQAMEAIEIGFNLVKELKEKGYKMIATGEMGIGNTTTSSAFAAVLLNMDPAYVTGPGAGLSSSGVAHKINVIKKAIEINKPDINDPIDVLSKLGGLDIAGMIGLFLGGAVFRVPLVVDGLISAVAGLMAATICPGATDFMFGSHISYEPAGKELMKKLRLHAVIDAQMHLGEGTGAVLRFPLFDMMVRVYNTMSTFDELQMEAYQPVI